MCHLIRESVGVILERSAYVCVCHLRQESVCVILERSAYVCVCVSECAREEEIDHSVVHSEGCFGDCMS